MRSYRVSISPHRRAATRFISSVRRQLQKAYDDASDVSQADLAKVLEVHRSVVNRQLRGDQDMSLGRVAEFACLLGLKPKFALEKPAAEQGQNTPTRVEGSLTNLSERSANAGASTNVVVATLRKPEPVNV